MARFLSMQNAIMDEDMIEKVQYGTTRIGQTYILEKYSRLYVSRDAPSKIIEPSFAPPHFSTKPLQLNIEGACYV